MTNIEKYNQVFCDNFSISEEKLNDLTYQSIQLWDSVGHMNLIAALEDEFDIMLETEDIVDFSGYKKGLEILKNNGIEF